MIITTYFLICQHFEFERVVSLFVGQGSIGRKRDLNYWVDLLIVNEPVHMLALEFFFYKKSSRANLIKNKKYEKEEKNTIRK